MKREEINDLAQLVQLSKLEQLYKKSDKNYKVQVLKLFLEALKSKAS